MKTSTEQAKLLNVIDAMTVLSVSRATLYRLMDRGELKPVLISKRRLITRREIDRFIRVLEERADAA